MKQFEEPEDTLRRKVRDEIGLQIEIIRRSICSTTFTANEAPAMTW